MNLVSTQKYQYMARTSYYECIRQDYPIPAELVGASQPIGWLSHPPATTVLQAGRTKKYGTCEEALERLVPEQIN